MATISLTYTISAQDQTRVVAAFQNAANTDINGSATPAQVLAYIQKSVKQDIIARVQAAEHDAAVAAIAAGTPPVLS